MREKSKRKAKRTFSPASPLETVLAFNEEDLEDNRAGYLSETQIAYYETLLMPRYWLTFLFPYIAYFFILSPFLIGVRSLDDLVEILSFMIWFSVCLSVFSLPISILVLLDKRVFRNNMLNDIKAAKVQVTYGIVFRRFKSKSRNRGDVYHWGGLKFSLMTLIKVGDEQLVTPYKSTPLFKEGFYAVYYLPKTKLVVAAEKYTARRHQMIKLKTNANE